MPAKKGAKRAAEQTADTAKKVKVDPAFQRVMDGLDLAENVPEECRKMLHACVPTALGVYSDERHETQVSAVKMIQEVLSEVEAKFKGAVDEEEAKVTQFEAKKGGLVQTQEKAEEVRVAASELVKTKTGVLAEVTETHKNAQGVLAEKQNIQATEDASLVAAKETKALLEKCLEEDVKVITADETGETDAQYKNLEAVLPHLAMDDSLKTALPSSCKKKASERGAFDNMVLEQLKTQFAEKLSSLGKEIDEAGPAAKERSDAVDTATAEVEKCAAAKLEAASELTSAKEAETTAKKDVETAKKAVADYEPEYKEATGVRDAKAAELDKFKTTSMASFEELRDRVSARAGTGGA